jgi:hypothetical protein
MPIRELRDADLDQECIECGEVRVVAFDEIEVGVAQSDMVDPAIVPLPECPKCGAREFLVRSAEGEEHPSPGSYSHLHRLLVDALHARLVKAERVVSGLDPKGVLLREPSDEVIGEWFKGGLVLPRSAKTDGGDQ